MRSDGRRRVWGIAWGAILGLAGIFVALLCVRTAIVKTLPPETPALAQLVPHDPDLVLDTATLALLRQRGILSPATLDAVRRAAIAAPLDARPFLILGHQHLLDRQPERALATLEAGQRLDPRQRVIHLLLLDRYLRTGRFAQAAAQFSVSARLVGSAGDAIAAAMAQMSLTPATRDAVRQTLRADPTLERSVLTALAKSTIAPATIVSMASPAALRNAGADGSWGPALVARLIQHDQYAEARSVWQHIYRLSDAQVAPLVFDAGFQKLPGSPPFNWTLAAGGPGAADMQNRGLNIDYYGRDSGEMAGQLLVLPAGAYRFGFTVEGSKTGAAPTLFWTLRCVGDAATELMRVAVVVTSGSARHRIGASFTVPAGCAAQRLAVSGETSEFPVPTTVTLRDLDLQAVSKGSQ
uniref:tetratricopeptide repeat protein n=1 Tax=uncultured Sphingomonas sp. TaxID=158754 RepID=UPI0035C9800F